MLDDEQDKDSRKEREFALKRAEDGAYRARFGRDPPPSDAKKRRASSRFVKELI